MNLEEDADEGVVLPAKGCKSADRAMPGCAPLSVVLITTKARSATPPHEAGGASRTPCLCRNCACCLLHAAPVRTLAGVTRCHVVCTCARG